MLKETVRMLATGRPIQCDIGHLGWILGISKFSETIHYPITTGLDLCLLVSEHSSCYGFCCLGPYRGAGQMTEKVFVCLAPVSHILLLFETFGCRLANHPFLALAKLPFLNWCLRL